VRPYYEDDAVTLYHGDCLEVLPSLSAGSVSLAVLDPPYHGVVDAEWDNQWASDEQFSHWLRAVIQACESSLADNGTMYCFCSPRMSARVEVTMSASMGIVSSCVWDKGDQRQGVAGTGVDVTSLRGYWPASERCIVAEKRPTRYLEADEKAKADSGYWSACETVKRSVFGDYLRSEFTRAGVTAKSIAALFPSRTGGMTGCVSNWLLGANCPTAEQYQKMRDFLNSRGDEYLRQNYEDLRQNYEDLRQNYEDLRQNYEDLRRPFFANKELQWGDVWRFDVPRQREHPTQKPDALVSQIIGVSSRTGDVVLDPTFGSGTTLVEAKRLGRKAIGIELDEKYCEIAARRLSQGALTEMFL
jgi:adenine-specific DNA-methyltransferase